MEEHYRVLKTLLEKLPEDYSDDNLHSLEQLVTRYQEILNQVAQTADPENNTMFYRERIDALENELKDARYGHDEKQRITGFRNASEMAIEGISALIFHLNQQHMNNAAGNTSN